MRPGRVWVGPSRATFLHRRQSFIGCDTQCVDHATETACEHDQSIFQVIFSTRKEAVGVDSLDHELTRDWGNG